MQKFSKYSFVHVGNNMPPEMAHFEKDFDAIVEGTYAQLYWGEDTEDYAVYVLENGVLVNQIAWYSENQLTLLPEQDVGLAKKLIKAYKHMLKEQEIL